MEERTIRVKGQGKISVPPDTIEINMVLISVKPTYEEAMNAASKALDDLRNCLKSVGFEKEDIKTTRFAVNTKYENVRDDNGNYKNVFLGYEVTNNLKIEFEQNNIKLGRVLNALSACPSTPEFSILYKIKDDTKAKNLLLWNAIEDAKEKAKIMSQVAGVRLGKILSIDYTPGEIGIYREMYSVNKGLPLMANGAMIDLVPENLELEDSVIIVWKIES